MSLNRHLIHNGAGCAADVFARVLGHELYELKDHLGNVHAVITDRKVSILVSGAHDHYIADVSSVNDYYAFGMEMPGRSFSANNYRYGFNGQEKDDEISGNSTSNTAEFWQYDTRLGRRWNVDPIIMTSVSPYACFSNSPIIEVDPKGNFNHRFGAELFALFNGGNAYKDRATGEWGVAKVNKNDAGEYEVHTRFDWTTDRYSAQTDQEKEAIDAWIDRDNDRQTKEEWTQQGIWDPNLTGEEARKNYINLSLSVALPNFMKSGSVIINEERPAQLLLESQGMRLKRIAENPRLKELLDYLWRSDARLADGSTGAMIKLENSEGIVTSATGSHVQKAEDALIIAKKLLKNNFGVLSQSDRKVVFEIIENLTNGTGVKWSK